MSTDPEKLNQAKAISYLAIIRCCEEICASAEELGKIITPELSAIFNKIAKNKAATNIPALLREAKGYIISMAMDVMEGNSFTILNGIVRKRIELSYSFIPSNFYIRTWIDEFGDAAEKSATAKLAGNLSFLANVCDMAEEKALVISGKGCNKS